MSLQHCGSQREVLVGALAVGFLQCILIQIPKLFGNRQIFHINTVVENCILMFFVLPQLKDTRPLVLIVLMG